MITNNRVHSLGTILAIPIRFRDNRIHEISISKRTLIHSENEILVTEVTTLGARGYFI